jgi:hypothetical protein
MGSCHVPFMFFFLPRLLPVTAAHPLLTERPPSSPHWPTVPPLSPLAAVPPLAVSLMSPYLPSPLAISPFISAVPLATVTTHLRCFPPCSLFPSPLYIPWPFPPVFIVFPFPPPLGRFTHFFSPYPRPPRTPPLSATLSTYKNTHTANTKTITLPSPQKEQTPNNYDNKNGITRTTY